MDSFPEFDSYACVGDQIQWESGGFTLTARLAADDDSAPSDSRGHTREDMQRWRDGEWFYVGVVLSVSRNGIELTDHADSLWGVDCNFSDTSNAHLAEVAHDMEAEAIKTAKAEQARILKALS